MARNNKNGKNELSALSSQDLSAMQFNLLGLLDRPFARDIFLLKTNVAGCNHVPGMIGLLRELEPGQKLKLLREPENPYDKRAILVMNGDKKLGYLPRRLNGIFCRLMDAGKYLFATADEFVTDEDDDDYPWDALIISIYLQD